MELVMQQANDKTFAFSFQHRAIIFQNGKWEMLISAYSWMFFLQLVMILLNFISLYWCPSNEENFAAHHNLKWGMAVIKPAGLLSLGLRWGILHCKHCAVLSRPYSNAVCVSMSNHHTAPDFWTEGFFLWFFVLLAAKVKGVKTSG